MTKPEGHTALPWAPDDNPPVDSDGMRTGRPSRTARAAAAPRRPAPPPPKRAGVAARCDTCGTIGEKGKVCQGCGEVRMTKPEGHTALPWQYSHRETSDGMYSTQVYDEAGETIATLAWYPVQDGSLTRTAREANAAMICRAVNCHADLVKALEEARDAIEEWGAYADPYFKEKWDLAGDISKIDAVLARAKEQTPWR